MPEAMPPATNEAASTANSPQMKPQPHLLFLVGGDHRQSDVGEQFLDVMLAGYPRTHVTRFSITGIPGSNETSDSEPSWHGSKVVSQTTAFSSLPIRSSVSYWRFRKFELEPTATAIEQLVAERKIEAVWIVLNHPFVIQIAAALQSRLNIPCVCHVWDTPEYLGRRLRLDAFTRNHLVAEFETAVSGCAGLVTVSPQMSKIYQQRFGVDSVPMVFCPPIKEIESAPQSNTASKNELTIAFAGSLYAWKEWNAFLDAVEQRNETQPEAMIHVVCIGNQSRWARQRSWVKYLPLQPMQTAAEMVAAADVAYLPYWMDSRHAYFVKTAFPGKLSFYVASGTPIFFHGPEYSTPVSFLQKYPVGLSCHSFRSDLILETLDQLRNDRSFREHYPEARQRALTEVFHPDRCVEIFQAVIANAFAGDPASSLPETDLA